MHIKFSVGRPTLVQMLANNVNGRCGLVCQFDGAWDELEFLENKIFQPGGTTKGEGG